MQTPTPMIAGIACTPVGLILVFTAVITPQWREGHVRLGKGSAVRTDGLWESCLRVAEPELKLCWPVSGADPRDAGVLWARGLLLGSLFLSGVGIVLAGIGARCWMDFPQRNVAGASGVVIMLSGLLCLATLGIYAWHLGVPAPDHPHMQHWGGSSLYFGWAGGSIEFLGGVALSLSFKHTKCTLCTAKTQNEDKEAYELN
ncbi:claudin-23 [Lepisosteus oculatus]|nr:PREDICTED: claudin-23-like [Lepisosteus oculatus]